MFVSAYLSVMLLISGGSASAMSQELDVESCEPEGEFYRCLMGERPVFLTPEEYELVRRAVASGATIEPNSPVSGTARAAETPSQAQMINQQLVSALDSIVQADSRGWMFNRYDVGSIRNARITERSEDGRSVVVYGEYTFNGGRAGNVRALITDGEVECLRFWDSPSCRPLGRSHSQALVAAAVIGAASSEGGGSSGSRDRNCQLERIGGQVQEVCYD